MSAENSTYEHEYECRVYAMVHVLPSLQSTCIMECRVKNEIENDKIWKIF